MTIPVTAVLGRAGLGVMVLGLAPEGTGVPDPVLVTRVVAPVIATLVLGGNQAPPPPDHLNYSPSSTLPYGDGG